MPEPKTIHRFTLLALIFIALGGGVLLPAFGLAGYSFIVGGAVWLIVGLIVVPVLLLALLLALVVAFRPR